MATSKRSASKSSAGKTSSSKNSSSKTPGEHAAGEHPTGRAGAGAKPSPEQGERTARSLSESAQQIWLAGVGAFGRAQVEGTKLFEGLVKEGLNLEQSARKFAGGQAEVMRDVVESGVGTARERAADTWDRLEKVFEERVQRAILKLDVPGREALNDLKVRVDTLAAELRRQKGAKTPEAPTSRPAAKRSAGGASRPAAATAKSPARAKSPRPAKSPGTAKPAKSAKKSAPRKSARKSGAA